MNMDMEMNMNNNIPWKCGNAGPSGMQSVRYPREEKKLTMLKPVGYWNKAMLSGIFCLVPDLGNICKNAYVSVSFSLLMLSCAQLFAVHIQNDER
jgi:hypothetical protein